jgi:hypothetical protein
MAVVTVMIDGLSTATTMTWMIPRGHQRDEHIRQLMFDWKILRPD